MIEVINKVVGRIFPGSEAHIVETIKSGLINTTLKIRIGEAYFAFQNVNTVVFNEPEIIHENLAVLEKHIAQNGLEFKLVAPLSDPSGESLIESEGMYYRIFPWVKEGHTIQAVNNPQIAYEAAKQFAGFTRTFETVNLKQLQPVIRNFHNLPLRYNQLNDAFYNAPEIRRDHIRDEFNVLINEFSFLVGVFNEMTLDPQFKQRVMHHDAKISNVLFDEADRGLCVIDLDTVMPGFIISDWGDMMRTYLSPANEEETDPEKVIVRKEYFEAIQDGYLEVMGDKLNKIESTSLMNSGMIIIYMQALRFLADHLNFNVYYGADYDGHNLRRARNQIKLLRELQRFAKEQK